VTPLRNGISIEERAVPLLPPDDFRRGILQQVQGRRIAALFGRAWGRGVRLYAFLVDDANGTLAAVATEVADRFDSLTPD
jgi:hypothetical protein